MTLAESSLTVRPTDGGDVVDIGCIALSSCDLVQFQVSVTNTARNHCDVKFSLDSELSTLFSIHSVIRLDCPPASSHGYATSSSTPIARDEVVKGEDALDPSNVNLLLAERSSLQEAQIPPDSSHVFNIFIRSLAQHFTHSSTLRSVKDANQPPVPISDWTGFLLVTDCLSLKTLASTQIAGKSCESLMKPDKDWLDFDPTSVDVWSYAEISIVNLSSVPTFFNLSTDFPVGGSNAEQACVRFLHADSDQFLPGSRVELPANSSVRVKVAVLPRAVGSEERWFSVQNVRNALDVWYIYLTIKATMEHLAERLDVSCGAELDFGDCYVNYRTFRDVTVQNNYSETISVAMLSDHPKQVAFEVLQEDDDATTVSSYRDDCEEEIDDVDRMGARTNMASFREETASQSISAEEYGPLPYGDADDSMEKESELVSAARTRLSENVNLWSGQRKRIRVWYVPSESVWDRGGPGRSSSQGDPCQLLPQRFQLVFKLPTEQTRTVVGRSRVCKSVIRLERREVHLGECDVLGTYRTKATVINCSDLPAYLKASYVSQCVMADVHDVVIPPRDTFDIGFEFVPRQVNPSYHKEITIRNLRNPSGQNAVFTLRANCVDRQGISLHALFYKILAPEATNEVDFGVTVANRAAIQAFRVRNETDARLVLKFECGAGVRTFAPPSALTRATWVAQRILGQNSVREMPTEMQQLHPRYEDDGEASDRWPSERKYRTAVSVLDPGVGLDYLPARCVSTHEKIDVVGRACSWGHELEMMEQKGAASGGEGLGRCDGENGDGRDNGNGSACRAFIDLGSMEGEGNWMKFVHWLNEPDVGLLGSMPTVFSNSDAEVQYMERQLKPVHSLEAAVRDGFLTETDVVSIPGQGEVMVVVSVLLTDGDVRGKRKLRTFEKRLVVRMMEYDEGWLVAAAERGGVKIAIKELVRMAQCRTPREVTLAVRACKSALSVEPLSQLNFGVVRVGDQKDKAFTIVNLSEAPLLYEIVKHGDDEGDYNELRLNVGRVNRGVVRPYFMRVVPFIFAPCVEGKFEQRVSIRNELDASAGRQLVIKAVIRK